MLFKGLGLLFNCLERKCLLLLPFYLTCDTPHLLNIINVCESLRPVGSIGIQCELKRVVEDQKPSVGVILDRNRKELLWGLKVDTFQKRIDTFLLMKQVIRLNHT